MNKLLFVVMALSLAGCDKATEWKGWVYPNRNALVADLPIGAFSSLEECRKSARNILDHLNTYVDGEKVQGDYECGFKCKPKEDLGGMNLCEKTER